QGGLHRRQLLPDTLDRLGLHRQALRRGQDTLERNILLFPEYRGRRGPSRRVCHRRGAGQVATRAQSRTTPTAAITNPRAQSTTPGGSRKRVARQIGANVPNATPGLRNRSHPSTNRPIPTSQTISPGVETIGPSFGRGARPSRHLWFGVTTAS